MQRVLVLRLHEGADQSRGHERRDVRSPVDHLADRGQQLGGGRPLQEIRGCARAERLGREIGILVHRQKHELRCRKQLLDLAPRIEPVQQWHPDIQHDHVRLQTLRRRLPAPARPTRFRRLRTRAPAASRTRRGAVCDRPPATPAFRAISTRQCYAPTEKYRYFFGSVVKPTISASVQVMSSLSPTLTCFSALMSCTRELYFQLFGTDQRDRRELPCRSR